MSIMQRAARWITVVMLACTTGILPSCASMGGGGGGMRDSVLEPTSSAEGLAI